MSIFQQIFVEIIEKIEIDENLIIHHADYPRLELKLDAIDRLKQLPPQLQAKFLIAQIQTYLYDIYFSHSLMSCKEIEAEIQQPSQIKNNIIDGVDVDFLRQLQQHNTSSGYIDRDWQVVAETENNELIVVKDGLHLHINRQLHLPKDVQEVAIGAAIPIYLPHNLVGQDTYIMVGNYGSPDRDRSVQIYFNFTPDVALAIAQKLTCELNRLGIPFQFAILHNPAIFYRYDTATLWLSQASYIELKTFLVEIYQVHKAEFSPNVPLFSKQLAPGLGIAEVPTTGTFGMQWCELLATGLLAAMEQDRTSTADKLSSIHQVLMNAGIDWQQPYLNPAAVDNYSVYIVE